MAEAFDTDAFTQRLFQALAHDDADIFRRVMTVDVQIAFAAHF